MTKSTILPLFLFIGLILVVTSYVSRCDDDNEIKSFSNSQMEAIYESTPEQSLGFSSNLYALTNYVGDKAIQLPIGDNGSIFISNVPEQDNSLWSKTGIMVKSLGNYIRISYQDEPFCQIGSTIYTDTIIKFFIHETTIDENSFAFINGYYDYQGDVGGLYVNGKIINRGIMVKGGVPFLPRMVKKIDNKTIIKFVSANHANLYALYSQKNNQLILPVDYKSIPNNWDSQEE